VRFLGHSAVLWFYLACSSDSCYRLRKYSSWSVAVGSRAKRDNICYRAMTGPAPSPRQSVAQLHSHTSQETPSPVPTCCAAVRPSGCTASRASTADYVTANAVTKRDFCNHFPEVLSVLTFGDLDLSSRQTDTHTRRLHLPPENVHAGSGFSMFTSCPHGTDGRTDRQTRGVMQCGL